MRRRPILQGGGTMKNFTQKALFCLIIAGSYCFTQSCGSTNFRMVQYIPGVYEGTGRGYRGPVTVSIEVSAYGIEDMAIIDSIEDEDTGRQAIDELLEIILEYGFSPDEIDAISGATASCNGFLQAVDNALSKAKIPVQ